MKLYTVILLQLIIWSGYTLIEWLSKHDEVSVKLIVLVIFVYCAMGLGNRLLQSKWRTFLATSISLTVYGLFYLLMYYIDLPI